MAEISNIYGTLFGSRSVIKGDGGECPYKR